MLISSELLKRGCEGLEIEIDNLSIQRFNRYAELLIEWNKKFNLTAITEPEQIVTKHFIDSLTFFSAVDPQLNSSLIDIGSGAGFPGLPIKILRNDMDITLLDSTNKRISFLQIVANELGLTISTIHGRAEDIAGLPNHREKYDFVTARAVASLQELAEYCLGFVKLGGSFIAMKGPSADNDISLATNAISLMGGKIDGITSKILSDGSKRTLVNIKKISQTPTGYPRCSAKISKKPL